MTERPFDPSHTDPSTGTSALGPLPPERACPECGHPLSPPKGPPANTHAVGVAQSGRRGPRTESLTFGAGLSTDDGQTVIRIVGDLDVATTPDLLSVLRAAAGRPGLQILVVDLAGTDFVDSTGVDALDHARRLCADRHVELSLRAVGRRARRVLTISGMTQTFNLSDGDGGCC